MAPTRSAPPQAELTWGERIHIAYRRARTQYGLTQERVVEKLEPIWPTSTMSLKRLEDLAEPPAQRKQQKLAYFALLAYGCNPSEYGLDLDQIELDPQVAKRAAHLLKPSNRRLEVSAA